MRNQGTREEAREHPLARLGPERPAPPLVELSLEVRAQTRLAAAEALLLRVDDALEDEGPWLVLQAHIRAFLADSAILPVPATDGGRKRS